MPTWLWLRDDPTIVWIPRSHDVRAHDLRALVGTEVVAMVDSLSKRRNEIAAAMDEVGATLAGIADQEVAEWCLPHPYRGWRKCCFSMTGISCGAIDGNPDRRRH